MTLWEKINFLHGGLQSVDLNMEVDLNKYFENVITEESNEIFFFAGRRESFSS